jgi:pectin methylesterase-like acyl-CoA thioesterase
MSGEKKFMKVNDDGSVTITLSRPLEVNGAKLSQLVMREPLVRDQLAASKARGDEAEKEVTFFANLCEVDPASIQNLPVRDYKRLSAAYENFID